MRPTHPCSVCGHVAVAECVSQERESRGFISMPCISCGCRCLPMSREVAAREPGHPPSPGVLHEHGSDRMIDTREDP